MNTHVRLAALVLGLLVFTSSLFAGQSSETMTVSVQVIARAVVTVDGPASINVTEADVARGYVDVPAPLLVRVRTNSRSGYVLQVENLGETFSSVELKSSEIEMKVGSHESWIQRPYVAGGDLMPLQARLRLAPTATAGSVAMPIAFSASAL